jgi:integrase/recombinase XerD
MSTLTNELERYLEIRRSLGFHLSTTARVLKRFVAFADAEAIDHITTDLFLRWKEEFGEASSCTWAARLGMVRQFAQWLSGIDSSNEVPSKALIPGRYRRARPHIYSDQEIVQIIDEAARLHSVNGIRALTYSTLFGLIAVTGLRVSEAVALDNGDIDVANAVLTIRRGKFGKARIIPISRSSLDRLTEYAKERDRLLGRSPKSFFVSDNGKRPGDCSVRYNFASVCQHIGLRPAQRFYRYGRGPRIHDLRHTFAARTLTNWYRNGMDPEREMIKLSTYLGHTDPVHTYWYIEAVPELLELASQRATRSLAQEGSR